ncbi:hypothetical protein AOXY_G28554 [Acipenser oxyrinchus oxyrinchus]|nr:hypothetical protein AOXY_G28554 [Acipenser oxyrinchus oxyrinchus]
MKYTFQSHQQWIKEEHPVVKAILRQYLRFLDVPGLVSQDFQFLGVSDTSDAAPLFEGAEANKVIRFCQENHKCADIVHKLDGEASSEAVCEAAVDSLVALLPVMGGNTEPMLLQQNPTSWKRLHWEPLL